MPPVQSPQHVVCQWGLVLIVQADGAVLALKEKELNSKLELLYTKSLYLLAINLAQSDQVTPALPAHSFPLHSMLLVHCFCHNLLNAALPSHAQEGIFTAMQTFSQFSCGHAHALSGACCKTGGCDTTSSQEGQSHCVIQAGSTVCAAHEYAVMLHSSP